MIGHTFAPGLIKRAMLSASKSKASTSAASLLVPPTVADATRSATSTLAAARRKRGYLSTIHTRAFSAGNEQRRSLLGG
jgi:hypothetical protein